MRRVAGLLPGGRTGPRWMPARFFRGPRDDGRMSDANGGAGTNVFLVPVDPERFERTVATPIELDGDDDRPAALSGLETVRLWGAGEGERSQQMFEQLTSGDLLLFHHGGRYVGVGRVGEAFVDEAGWASRTIWDDAPMTHLFTVTDFSPLDVGVGAVNRLFDYGPEYAPGSLMRVADDRVTSRLDAIELAVIRYDERQS